jgi:hypothetical protein
MKIIPIVYPQMLIKVWFFKFRIKANVNYESKLLITLENRIFRVSSYFFITTFNQYLYIYIVEKLNLI